MNSKQIQKFTMRYLEATGCQIVEKHPAYVTVKLSPEADKRLTNRSYYWSFVERTGAPPETMTFTFIFDPEAMPEPAPAAAGSGGRTAAAAQPQPPAVGAGGNAAAPSVYPQPGLTGADGRSSAIPNAEPLPGSVVTGGAAASDPAGGQTPAPPPPAQSDGADSILGRYFGVTASAPIGLGRIPREEITFGSRRLQQLFDAVRSGGRFVQLFEQQPSAAQAPPPSAQQQTSGYSSFLVVMVKIELQCDMKRDELHVFGVNLATGELLPAFDEQLSSRKLTPRLPPRVYIAKPQISVARARTLVEQHVERMLKRLDHNWAQQAQDRLESELVRVDGYYSEAIKGLEEEKRAEAEQQWEQKRKELTWQYKPRIRVFVTNGGLFHLRS